MKKTLLVMIAEIRVSLHRKTFVLFALALPLVLGLIALTFMIANRGGSEKAPEPVVQAVVTNQGYVDEGGLIRTLPAEVTAGELAAYGSRQEAQAALDAGQIGGYFVVPADYLQNGKLTYVARSYNPLEDRVNADTMKWVLLVNLLGGDEQTAHQVWEPARVTQTQISTPVLASNEDNWITELFPVLMVLILYMVILIPAGSLVNSVTDEKKNRVLEVVMTSVSSEQFIVGKILALGLLGLVSAFLWFGVLWVVIAFGGQSLQIPAGFSVPTSLLVWSLVFFLGGYAIYGSQMAGLGAVASDFRETRSASFIIMLPIIIAYMLNMVIVNNPNGPVAVFLSLFPLTSPVSMINRLAIADVPLWQPVLATVLMFATAAFIVRLTAKLFRVQNLLAGRPFSLQGYYRSLLGHA